MSINEIEKEARSSPHSRVTLDKSDVLNFVALARACEVIWNCDADRIEVLGLGPIADALVSLDDE